MCGKAEKRRILLCYHSRDEGNVKKFLKSLHNIKADVIVKNESETRDDDDDYSNFSKGIVLVCLSEEFVVTQAFTKGTSTYGKFDWSGYIKRKILRVGWYICMIFYYDSMMLYFRLYVIFYERKWALLDNVWSNGVPMAKLQEQSIGLWQSL